MTSWGPSSLAVIASLLKPFQTKRDLNVEPVTFTHLDELQFFTEYMARTTKGKLVTISGRSKKKKKKKYLKGVLWNKSPWRSLSCVFLSNTVVFLLLLEESSKFLEGLEPRPADGRRGKVCPDTRGEQSQAAWRLSNYASRRSSASTKTLIFLTGSEVSGRVSAPGRRSRTRRLTGSGCPRSRRCWRPAGLCCSRSLPDRTRRPGEPRPRTTAATLPIFCRLSVEYET